MTGLPALTSKSIYELRLTPKATRGYRTIDLDEGGAVSNFLSIKQALAMLGISRPTLNKLMRTGQLAFHKVGHRVLIAPSDLEEFMKARRVVEGSADGGAA